MAKMRVLIVDDSVIFRSQIRAALSEHPAIEVIGAVANGRIALAKLVQDRVDLVVLDWEMPELGGLETLRAIKDKGMADRVIVFSALTPKGADAALEALRNGADDVVAKPSGPGQSLESAASSIRAALLNQVLQFHRRESSLAELQVKGAAETRSKWLAFLAGLNTLSTRAVVIGSSTGGPNALEVLLTAAHPPNDCPIFIAQHMPAHFTSSLARRIEKASGLVCKEGEHNEIVKPGHIYVAPGDYHMTVARVGKHEHIRLDQTERRNSVRPAVDNLFESAAVTYGRDVLALVLTGMGEDGLLGAQMIRSRQGKVIIQSKNTCVVFGMPGAIMSNDCYDAVADLVDLKNLFSQRAKSVWRKIG